MPTSDLLRFYLHESVDTRGRRLREIRSFSLDQLEHTHDYIQWLFPLPERSSANLHAPLLSDSDMQAFAADDDLRGELIESLRVMLRFFGLGLDEKSQAPYIGRSDDFRERQHVWLTPYNHNFLRITRILRSLSLLGCYAYAAALLRCLEAIHTEYRDVIGPRTMQFWRNALPQA